MATRILTILTLQEVPLSREDNSSDVISSSESVPLESQDPVNRTHAVRPSVESNVLLTSWNVLKRDAGCYTQSGMYRGGLYKRARGSYHEEFQCTDKHRDYCLLWETIHSSNDRDPTICRCDSKGDLPVCDSWRCSRDNRECVCQRRSAKDSYCLKWKCVQKQDGDNPDAEEDYECMSNDASGEYCLEWKGDIASSYQMSSAVCRCTEANKNYCTKWECDDRWLVRCASHSGGWCDMRIALGVGCLLGLFPVIIAAGFLGGGTAHGNAGGGSCVVHSAPLSSWLVRG